MYIIDALQQLGYTEFVISGDLPTNFEEFEARIQIASADTSLDLSRIWQEAQALIPSIRTKALIKALKNAAGKRIEAAVPAYQQTNALSDIARLSAIENLSEDDIKLLEKSKARLNEVKRLRELSDKLEYLVLSGEVIDPEADSTWQS